MNDKPEDTVEEEYVEVDAIDPPQLYDGTYCEACYLLFAKSDGYKIGIRPLFNSDYEQTYIGFRIRAMVDENSQDADVDFTGGDSIASAFPNFPFKKSSHKRCSLVGGVYVGLGHQNGKELAEWVTTNRIVGKIVSALKEFLGENEIIDEGAVYSYLAGRFEELMEAGTVVGEDEVKGEIFGSVVHMDEYKAKAELQHKQHGDESEEAEAEDAEAEEAGS